jgi:hypothetical protein
LIAVTTGAAHGAYAIMVMVMEKVMGESDVGDHCDDDSW